MYIVKRITCELLTSFEIRYTLPVDNFDSPDTEGNSTNER